MATTDPRLLDVLDRLLAEIAIQQAKDAARLTGSSFARGTTVPSDEEWADVSLEAHASDADVEVSLTAASGASSVSSPASGPDSSALPGNTVLPEGAVVQGDLLLQSQFTAIHAAVHGNITAPADGELLIGRNSVITGHLKAGRVRIEGLVYGNVEAVRLSVVTGAVVRGDVSYQTNLIIDDGAEVHGNIKRNARPL